MAVLERRRISKWHKQITASVREIPSSEALSKEEEVPFPYAQVHALTKEYLGKRKRSQIEKDKALIELINGHPCKEVAFASCADALSEPLVEELLNSIFHVDSVNLHGLEAYLQAFAAAARSKNNLFLPSDLTIATSLIPVARDVVNQQITPATAVKLFSTWKTGTPVDRLLLCRVKLLSRIVCQRMSADLARRQNPAWWTLAKDYGRAVSILETTSIDLEDILYSTFPAWQSWANWRPDVSRLEAWASVTSTGPFRCLRDLEAPALKSGDHMYDAEWLALIRKGELLSWLESKAFTLGPGLITDDREDNLVDFLQRLLNTVVSALTRGLVYAELLRLLVDIQGLDLQPLAMWNDALAMLDSEFISIICKSRTKEDSDIVLVRGLRALSVDKAQAIRTTLGRQIGKCVGSVAQSLQERFLTLFASDLAWVADAQRLWILRDTVVGSKWLHPFVGQRILNAGRRQATKTSKSALSSLKDLQNVVHQSTGACESDVGASIDVYVQRFVLDGAVTHDDTTAMPKVLHTLWICTARQEIRKAAIIIASLTDFDLAGRTMCIRQLLSLPKELVQDLHDCMFKLPDRQYLDFVSFTRIVALVKRTPSTVTDCWRNLFRWFMDEYNFHPHRSEFMSFGFKAYADWIAHLYEIFVISLEGLTSTYKRMSQLRIFEPVIEALEARFRPRVIMSKLLIDADEFTLDCYQKILQCLSDHSDSSRLELLYVIILTAGFESWKAEALCSAVCGISALSDSGFSSCQTLIDLYQNDRRLACSRLNVWLRMSWFDAATEQVLVDLARVLNLTILNGEDLPATSVNVTVAKDFYNCRVAEMVEAAQRLEHFRKLLKKVDPEGVDSVVAELKVEQPTGAAQMMADLPDDLVDVIDEASEDVVELHFPLSSPNLTTMERLACGLKGSESLLVRLQVDISEDIDGFCVHLVDGDSDNDRCDHNFTTVDLAASAPDRLSCHGRQNRLTYMVARQLWRQLRAEESSLKGLYEGIRQSLHTGASQCLICSQELEASLHRPTLCTSASCEVAYRRSHLNVRLEDIRVDDSVVDLLLSSVFAAASIGNLELLPKKPLPLGDGPKVVELLNSMPITSALVVNDMDHAESDELDESLFSWLSSSFPGFMRPTSGWAPASSRADHRDRHEQTDLLLTWLCNSYRGFVISATDRYKIPNFPNVQQFLLVDAPPEIEAGFAKHKDLEPRNILFHGTSIDRLYSVLCQGLRVLTGTSLQKHGSAHGPGIYFAREPALAMSFSSRTTMDGEAPFFASRGAFNNATVLLGCEHAGNDDNAPKPHGIHVITDPTRVMVRYIWIVPHGTKVPRAQDLKIPMLSTFNDLRLTAVGRTR